MKRKRQFKYPELQELAENKLNTEEKIHIFFEIWLVMILVYMVIILPLEFICLFGLLFIPIYLMFESIRQSYSSRGRIVEVFEKVLDYSEGGLSIESLEKDSDKRVLHLKSTSKEFPDKFSLSFASHVLTGPFVHIIFFRISTEFKHPFFITLFKKSSKKHSYNYENKNLEKIAEQFDILDGAEYLLHLMEDKLVVLLYGINIYKYPEKGAFHIIKVLRLMQSIISISTQEKPVLRDQVKGETYASPPPRVTYSLATVCFKCEKPIRFWKKHERGTLRKCPDCGSPTNTIIAPYRESQTCHKIRMMNKVMESFNKEDD